ncbi:hypothetical protein Tco_0041178 [Tanacetum coccineum]
MDDPNITMEEYIRLEKEKARKRGKVFNWETAKYGRIWYDEDVHDLRYVETEFPAIAFNDQISSEKHFLVNPRYEEIQYTDADIVDFETRLARIYMREVYRVQGVILFTSRAWRRLFDIRGPLVHELILEFFSTFRFGEAILDLDTPGALQFQLGGARRRLSWSARQILDKGDLRDYWIGISSAGYFLGTTPSYTSIRDPILMLCHRLIACSIAGRSQAPEKPMYLRLFIAGRKSEALISGGQFVAQLAKHFGLLTEKRLWGLTVIALALPVIDMAELGRLQICVEIDDTWAWVALRPERQPDVAVGAPEVDEDAPAVDEDMPQAVPPPPPRTQGERIARLEEEVHGMRELLQGQSEVLDHMARDFSRFATWTVTSLARMMDRAGVTYTSYYETPGEYQRHTRQRTGEASTSTTQQD